MLRVGIMVGWGLLNEKKIRIVLLLAINIPGQFSHDVRNINKTAKHAQTLKNYKKKLS